MTDAFPTRTKRQRVLININALVRRWDAEGDLDYMIDDNIMAKIAEECGLPDRELRRILAGLVTEGYLAAEVILLEDDPLPIHVFINDLTDKGLVEIGELPDAEEKLIEGLRAAIRTIEADDTLTEEEKRPKIDWLKEGIALARSLGTAAMIQILVGGTPPTS